MLGRLGRFGVHAPGRRSVGRWAMAMVAMALVAAGCGSSSSGGGSGQVLTLYNAQHEETTDALIKAFTKQTGIAVRVKSDDEDVLTAQLEQEGTRSPADVFFTENSNWLQQLDNRGLLARVAHSTLVQVPARDSASNGDWLGVSGRFSVLVYNPAKISASQLPKSVLALADPRYKGQLELAPAETDFWPIITSVAHADGHARALVWLEGLKANAGSQDNVPDNETLVSDVSKGIADMGLIDHYYYYRLRAEIGAGSVHSRLAYFNAGDPGFVEDISGAAIVKSTKHLVAAQKFLAFLTSRAGQRVLEAGDSFEYPLAAGVAPNPALPLLRTLDPSSITPAEIGTGLDAKALLQQAGLI
jgi:iron(III) transport system substrate-binding protein